MGTPLDKYKWRMKREGRGQEEPHVLGEGASGTVILATDKSSNEKVAIKVIHMPSQPKKELVLKELDVRRQIKTNFLIFKKIFQQFFASRY